MPNYTVTNNIDALLKSTSNAAARTNLGLGDAATKNTGTTAGTVAAGNDSRITGALQTSGGTMTGRIVAAADNSIAKISLGARTLGSSPTALVDGDIWISNQGSLSYRDSTGPTSRAVAVTSLSNTFNQPQTIGSTANAGAVLAVSNSGTREVVTISNTTTATSDAVVITNLGSGNSLVVNDETTPDSTRFAVANNGRVGIGVAPDAAVALAVDFTGIKFSDGTTQTTAASGGSGTVTSITAGTGLTGGTITTSGTVAADFGTTTGKVTEGGTTVLKTGDTMTGKLTLPAATTTAAPINIGSSGVQPITPVTGDVWIRNNLIQYKGSSATVNSVAATAEPNSFSARQTIQVTDNTNPALRVTQLGTGEALRVEDEANPDATAFVVSASGKVGVGVTPDVNIALSVDASGIKFSDGSVQTTASGGGVAGVSSFSAGTTGLTPATGTTGAVTLGGTLGVANGGTGQTTANAALNALLPSQASNSGKVLSTDGANTSWITAGGGGGGTPVDRQVFTSSGTWTKPAGAKYIQVTLIGGGGSGGAGTKRVVTPTSALAQGGSGGASGQVMKSQFAASELPSTVSVTIPTVAPKYYPGYLCNNWSVYSSGLSGLTASFGPFIKNITNANRGSIAFFDSTTAGGASVGFDSNAGATPGGSPTASGRGSSGGVGGLNTGAGAGTVNSLFGFASLSTPPLTTQPSTTTNFTSPLPTSPMQGTGSFGDNQSSGGACGMSVANTLCLGGSAGDGGGWFPPVNLTSVATTSGSSTVTCASTTGLNVGMAIIPSSGFANPTNRLLYVASITNSTTFVVSANANATTSGQTALATCGYGGGGGGGGSAQASTPILITGVNLTSGSTTVDCTSTRGVLVGLTIFNNANIPAGTTVASLVSETQFTISVAATGSETAGKLVVAGVGTISGFATTSNSTSATVTSTLGMTWGQALWASSAITPATSDQGYRHVDGVSSATAFSLSSNASATASGLTLYAMNCIGFVGGASTTLGSNIVTVSDTTPLYVGMMVSIVSAANTWSTTSGSLSATSTNPIPVTVSGCLLLGDGVSAETGMAIYATAGSTAITLSSGAKATVANKTFYYACPTNQIVFPNALSARSLLSYARIVSIDSATQITVDTNALAAVSGQTLAYAFTGGAGGGGGGAAVEVVTYF